MHRIAIKWRQSRDLIELDWRKHESTYRLRVQQNHLRSVGNSLRGPGLFQSWWSVLKRNRIVSKSSRRLLWKPCSADGRIRIRLLSTLGRRGSQISRRKEIEKDRQSAWQSGREFRIIRNRKDISGKVR